MQWHGHAVHLPGRRLQRHPEPHFRNRFPLGFAVTIGITFGFGQPNPIAVADPNTATRIAYTAAAHHLAGRRLANADLGQDDERKPVPRQR